MADPVKEAADDAMHAGLGVLRIKPDGTTEHVPLEEFYVQRDPVKEAVERAAAAIEPPAWQ